MKHAIQFIVYAVVATSAVQLGCGHTGTIAAAIIDCTKADNEARIDKAETEIKKIGGWPARYATAVAFGVVIGGCALLRVVQHETATPSATVLPTGPNEGAASFERFRREQANGANFKTITGTY